MKKIILSTIFACLIFISFAQGKKIYDPKADAGADIKAAVKKAKETHKFVLVQAGGNWCSWCIEFARFAKANAKIDSTLNASFVWYHLNYSKENENKSIFAKYGYPQRFGFPVFLILNDKGELIHTGNSSYLEDGKKSYDAEKVIEFLEMWKPAAFDPKQYETK
jgi:thioredoxin-related protein